MIECVFSSREMRFNNRREAFVFWYGAIAQLGERVLCKHEVVGSIPSGSTTLRPSGYAWRSLAGAEARSVPGVALLGEDGLTVGCQRTSSAKHHFAGKVFTDFTCGISDIVKRRSIRVLDLQSNLRNPNS